MAQKSHFKAVVIAYTIRYMALAAAISIRDDCRQELPFAIDANESTQRRKQASSA
jgi:hypothetical protein